MSKQRPDFMPPSVPERKPAPTPAAVEQKPKPKLRQKSPSPWPWGRFRRALVSVLLVFHLAAVFSAPWYIQLRDVVVPQLPPGTPVLDAQGRMIPLEQLDPRQYPPQQPHLPLKLYNFFFHYANLLYINSGYDFFSPDPVPNDLVRYSIYNSTGEEIASDTFPDRKSQWPRLFYHRHMMLTAQLGALQKPTDAQPTGLRLYARKLLRDHPGAARVHMELGKHNLLTPQQVLDGKLLDASDTFQSIVEVDEYAEQASARTEGAVRIPGASR